MPAEQFRPLPQEEPEEIKPLKADEMKFIRLEDIKPERKGPPPIPEAARRKGPPPIPEKVRKASMEKSRKSVEQLQAADVVDAFEIPGFDGMEVSATLEKKDIRKQTATEEERAKEGELNQDTILADPETGLVGVFDGAGGEGNGDLASKAAALRVPEEFKEAMKQMPSGADLQKAFIEEMMKKTDGSPESRVAVTKQAENLMELDTEMVKRGLALVEAIKKSHEAVKETGGGTTATVGFMHELPDGRKMLVAANVGDGGILKRRVDGSLATITQEDSLENYMLSKGMLTEEKLAEMKAEPTKKHTFGRQELSYKDVKRTIISAMGAASTPQPWLSVDIARKGEEFYFVSDGVLDKYDNPETDEMEYDDMAIPLADESTPSGKPKPASMKDKVDRLRKEAKGRTTYKKDDDIGIVGIRAK